MRDTTRSVSQTRVRASGGRWLREWCGDPATAPGSVRFDQGRAGRAEDDFG